MSDMWGDQEEQQDMLPMSFVIAGGIALLGGLVYGLYTFKHEHRLSGAAVIAAIEGLLLIALGHRLTRGRDLAMLIHDPSWDEDVSVGANEACGYAGAWLNRELINRFQKAIMGGALAMYVILVWLLEQICPICV